MKQVNRILVFGMLLLLCGTISAWAEFCSKCGREAKSGDQFCSGCGNKLGSGQQQQQQQQQQQSVTVNVPAQSPMVVVQQSPEVVFEGSFTFGGYGTSKETPEVWKGSDKIYFQYFGKNGAYPDELQANASGEELGRWSVRGKRPEQKLVKLSRGGNTLTIIVEEVEYYESNDVNNTWSRGDITAVSVKVVVTKP